MMEVGKRPGSSSASRPHFYCLKNSPIKFHTFQGISTKIGKVKEIDSRPGTSTYLCTTLLEWCEINTLISPLNWVPEFERARGRKFVTLMGRYTDEQQRRKSSMRLLEKMCFVVLASGLALGQATANNSGPAGTGSVADELKALREAISEQQKQISQQQQQMVQQQQI